MKNTQQLEKNELDIESTWQELYIITKHWKSDIQFYKDDLKFLQHLINKYLIWITKKNNLDNVMLIGSNLLKTSKQCEQLNDAIDKHLSHLAGLIKDPFKNDYQSIKVEHLALEDQFSEFLKLFRKNKKETFAITEYVVDDEQLIHHLEA